MKSDCRMNSTITMYILLAFYALITVQALWERNWWRSVSVLAMTLHPEPKKPEACRRVPLDDATSSV